MNFRETNKILKEEFKPKDPCAKIEMRHQYYSATGIVWTKWYLTKADTPRKPYQGNSKVLKNEYREIK